jgi:hypothetical protein
VLSNVSLTSIVDWFSETNANQHVTSDLEKLDVSESYLGNDNLHVGDNKRLLISHINHTKLYTPHHTFTLSNVLHVPHITSLVLFVHSIAFIQFL